jgi:CMP-N-acetylneuraminic acid synthetase
LYNGRRVLIVIPARGGSQGVKLKNLRCVGGISLVARAAKVAQELSFADRAVVSTDHEEIARVGQDAGLAVPFRRPENLSGPVISDWQVLFHALTEMEKLDGVRYDIVVMLQPTSPSRSAQQVSDAVAMLDRSDLDAVWTVSETDGKAHPLKQLTVNEDGEIDYYDQRGKAVVARQQLPAVYHRNGIAYAFTRDCLLEQRTTKGRRTGALVISGPVVNIDTELDLAWADFLAARGLLESQQQNSTH